MVFFRKGSNSHRGEVYVMYQIGRVGLYLLTNERSG